MRGVGDEPVAYLLTLFPKLSETFVLNEVVNLQRAGLCVIPVSLARSADLEEKAHAAAGQLAPGPVYAADGFPFAHVRALAEWLVRRPVKLARLVITNHRHPAPRGESRAARLALALAVGSLLEGEGIRRVHAHWSYPADIAHLLAPLLGLSVSLSEHAHDIYEDIDLYERDGLSYSARIARAAFVATCTSTNAEYVRSRLPAELRPRVVHVYHGLDLSDFAVRAPEVVARPTILSVGRQVWCKGFDVVIEAAARLRDRGLDFQCLLIGPTGPETPKLAAMIDELHLGSCVRLLGPLTQEELRVQLARSSMLVNASWPHGEYGVANVIVEAMACGVPVIATDRPQVREYLSHGVNGLLTRAGEVDDLVAAVIALVRDPSLGEQLALAARTSAETLFDVEQATYTLLGLFRAQESVAA
jgi:glycosyltransferase involved in cell wall biosynthesis